MPIKVDDTPLPGRDPRLAEIRALLPKLKAGQSFLVPEGVSTSTVRGIYRELPGTYGMIKTSDGYRCGRVS